MLVELGLVEQRYKAVCEVLDGATVVDVARRNGVVRQTVHDWLRRYARGGLAGLADGSSKPQSCPHQMAPEVEVRILELRRAHPGWGPRSIGHRLQRDGVEPVPGRSSIYRCLVRHGLITPQARRRRRSDYKRWERSRAMELWQMDIVGGVVLSGGREAKIVTGIDDHSRFCVSAYVVPRATARPTCDALALAMRTHGVPDQILTDNGKVFTGRFGPGTGEVLFDRICRENGIRHLLTAPRSPTTTGKVERFHKTLRRVPHRQGLRLHRGGPGRPRRLGGPLQLRAAPSEHRHGGAFRAVPPGRLRARPGRRRPTGRGQSRPGGDHPAVGRNGRISFAAVSYRAGVWLAGQDVTVVCDGALVHLHHRGVLIATHARRHAPDKQAAGLRRNDPKAARRRPTASSVSVTRKVDSSGNVCFAGASYRAGSQYRRRQVQVAVVGDTVEISIGTELIRTHPVRHDRTREHGALANPGGRPRRINAA